MQRPSAHRHDRPLSGMSVHRGRTRHECSATREPSMRGGTSVPRRPGSGSVVEQMEQITLRDALAGADDEAVTQMFVEYLEWAHPKLRDEYGIEDPPTSPEKIAESLVAFRRPDGVLLIAEREGHAVGAGALRRHSPTIAEVKRMFVRPQARSLHIGSSILDRLIEEAQAMGAQVVRLDTVRFMTDAQRLYRSRGFLERPPYEGTEIPEPLRKYWLFFERAL